MTGFAAGRLDVDLDAIAANWHRLAAQHRPGPVAAVLKADAYGVGATPVASRLLGEGCRHFFTATIDEAIHLRRVAPPIAAPVRALQSAAAEAPAWRQTRALPGAEAASSRVFVGTLNGLPRGAAPAFAAHQITPALGSLDEIEEWSAHARTLGRTLPALLHIDTGMARLGLPPDELAVLAAEPDRLDGIAVRYLMSHLASSERGVADPGNEEQLRRFAAACSLLPDAPRCLANSSGIFLGPRYATDLARAGAGLLGINPQPGTANPLVPAVRLHARVLQVRHIATGETVGYNATWTARRPSRIATVGVGYADGWPRALSNRGIAAFDGVPVPLVGRVSMDLSCYDVTDTPTLRPGDWLELIGPNRPIEEVATAIGTIPYELLTSLGRRFDRVYHG